MLFINYIVLKLYHFLSTLIFKTTFVILIIGALTLSSTLESMSLLTKNSFEIENIDWQEDSSEEKENEKKEDNKIQNFPKANYSRITFKSNQKNLFYFRQISNIYIDIQVPPPEII